MEIASKGVLASWRRGAMAAVSSAMYCRGTATPFTTKCCLPSSFSSSSSASMRLARVSFSPFPKCRTGSRRRKLVVAWANEEPFDAQKVLNEAWKDLGEAWDKVQDKAALGILGFSVFLTMWASGGVVVAIEKLPLFPSLFELIGVFYSAWFAYRYLLFKPDRVELQEKVKFFWDKVTDTEDTH